MTDPTEAIRKAREHITYLRGFFVGEDVSARKAYDIADCLKDLLDRLDSAERDQRRYQWTLHHLGLIEERAMLWNPSKHKPLLDYLQDFIDATLRVGAVGKQKEPT